MIEILLLSFLKEAPLGLYGLNKKIENELKGFYIPSFGSINPALKRLATKGFVTVESSISDGGQRKNLFSITQTGAEHLVELLKEQLPKNPVVAEVYVDVLAYILNKNFIDIEDKKIVVSNILDYLKLRKNLVSSLKENSESFKYIEFTVNQIDEKIKYFSKLL